MPNKARPDDGYYLYSIVVDDIVRYIGISHNPARRFDEHKRECLRYKTLMARGLAKAIEDRKSITQVILEGPIPRIVAESREIEEIQRLGGCRTRGRQLWNSHKGGYGGASDASSAVLRERWATDSGFRARMSESARRQIAEQRADPSFEKKRIASVTSANAATSFQNLVLARKNIDRVKHQKLISEMSKKRWADPEYRARQVAAISAARRKAEQQRRAVSAQ